MRGEVVLSMHIQATSLPAPLHPLGNCSVYFTPWVSSRHGQDAHHAGPEQHPREPGVPPGLGPLPAHGAQRAGGTDGIHSHACLTCSPTHSLIYIPTHSLTHLLTHPLTHYSPENQVADGRHIPGDRGKLTPWVSAASCRNHASFTPWVCRVRWSSTWA